MSTIDRRAALEQVLEVAQRAAALVSTVYATPFGVEYKGHDNPVTRADREANALICGELARLYPDVPRVAEESEPSTFAGYASAEAAWFIDPLDGTREFVAKNGEFAVMIGLAEAGRATLGVIVLPALQRSFVGAEGVGAYEIRGAKRTPLRVSSVASLAQAEIVVSRSHRAASLEEAAARLRVRKMTPCGSAGVKATRVAAGEAEVFAQPGRAGSLWDACAPEAIVRGAGGLVTDGRGAAIDYASNVLDNDRGFIATNGRVHAEVLALVRAAEEGTSAAPTQGGKKRAT